jgi:V8-like Glu-specific endopeptidase
MKSFWTISLLLSVFSFYEVEAKNRVIYGDDDRLDLYEVQDNMYLELARSSAAMIPASSITSTLGGYKITGKTLEERGMCGEVKFAKQMTSAMCSGFLVGEDLLVSAGHCLRYAACDSSKWVFDYGIDDVSTSMNGTYETAKDNVYGCKEVISHKFESFSKEDYVLIRLDRKVVGRAPLSFRQSGKIAEGTKLVVIGHPTGLPTKVADGAWVRENTKAAYFSANLDTFGGNSGSAVFDAETGIVEGILVRGENDYVYAPGKNCKIPQVCTNTGCMGEEVSRITTVKKLGNF